MNRCSDALRVLVTVTFVPNQLRSHLLPFIALDEVDEIVLVTDKPGPPLAKVSTVVPPAWLRRLCGRAVSKLLLCLFIARRFRPEWVVGFNLVPHALTALFAARVCGARAMYQQIGGPREWLGGGWSSDNKILGRQRCPSRAIEQLLLAAVRRADAVAAMGERGRRALIERGVDPARIHLLPPATSIGHVQGRQQELCDYDIVTVGALLPNKRTTDLLAAVAALKRQGRSVRAVVVGTGPLQGALETQAAALGISESVAFLGFRDDVVEICARSRVFTLLSESEGLSVALLDAMALGVPAVVSDVGELSSLVEDGITGFLYKCGDIRALTQKLSLVLDDPHLQLRLGDAARHRAQAIGSVDVVSARLRQVLTEAIASPRDRSRGGWAVVRARAGHDRHVQ